MHAHFFLLAAAAVADPAVTAQKIVGILTTIGTVYAALVTTASLLMSQLPQGAPGSTWDTIRTVVNYLALNVKHAKNIQEK